MMDNQSLDEQSVTHRETRNIFKLSNICILVYIVLNVFLIWSILSWFTYTLNPFLYSIAIYAVSLLIALSPIGEFVLRLQTGCKKIKRDDHRQLIMPIFEEVYAKAKEFLPNLPDGIKIYLNAENEPNAFATGRRTICATRGFLDFSPEQMKAIFAHEFGHIAHRDTYILLAVIVGNFIVNFIVTTLWIVSVIITGFAKISAICSPKSDLGVGRSLEIMFTSLAHLAVIIGYNVFRGAWSWLGVLLCMKSQRGNEYEADRFAANCGYGRELISVLEFFAKNGGSAKGVFATLASSHPDPDSRIAALQEYLKEIEGRAVNWDRKAISGNSSAVAD